MVARNNCPYVTIGCSWPHCSCAVHMEAKPMSIKMNELEGLSKKAEELEIIRRVRKACAYFKSAQLTIQHDHFQMKKANETIEGGED